MFTIPKKYSKLLSIVLISLIIVTNPAFIVSVNAANSDDSKEQATITIDKSSSEMTRELSERSVDESTHLTDNQKFTQFTNGMISYYLKGGKKQGPEWLKTTDVKFSFTQDHKPIFSLETIQPFSQASEDGQLWFWQGRYAHQSNNKTANLGLGWRKLSPDKSKILGMNAFYDYGFKYNLSRIGIGTEYFNKLTECRANVYFPLSGDRQTGVSYSNDGILYSYIRAVQGLDYEIGSTLANARWLGFYVSGFYYDNKYNDDEKGYKLRSAMQITPRLSLDVGYEHSNFNSGSIYGKVMYQLADHLGPALYGGSNEQDKKVIDLSYKLLQKVERDNNIKTETFTKFVSYTGNLSAKVINSNGNPIKDVQLQAYQNGNPVGTAVLTGSSGVGVINGLAVGTYQVQATYFTYENNRAQNQVSVMKDSTASTNIQLPVVGGNIAVNVFDANGQSVSGATVTAHTVSSGQTASAEGTIFDRIFGVKTVFAAAGEFILRDTTDSQGQAHFNNLPPGNYNFTVEVNGQTMQSSISANIPTGGGNTKVDVVLPSSGTQETNGSAAIYVNDGSNVLGGATVSVMVNGTAKTVITNASGIAVISNLPAGSYTFTAVKSGYTSCTSDVIIASGVTATKTISLSLVQQMGTVSITVVNGAVIAPSFKEGNTTLTPTVSGNVYALTLTPGSHTITVSAAGYNDGTVTTTIINGGSDTKSVTLGQQTGIVNVTVTNGAVISPTFKEGNTTLIPTVSGNVYTLTLTPGSHTITVSAAGYSDGMVTTTIINGGTDNKSVTLGQQTGIVNVTVTNGAVISPTFKEGTTALTPTATNGNVYTFTLTPGGHNITVSAAGYSDGTVTTTIINGGSDSKSVTLGQQTGIVNVTVTNGAVISPTFKEGTTALTPTAMNGNVYTFTLTPGSHTITVSAAGYNDGTVTTTITNGGTDNKTVTLTRQTGSATILVQNSNSVAIAGATVTLNGTAVTTGPDGKAIFSNVPTGIYNYAVTATDYSDSNTNSITITTTSTAPVTPTVTLTRQTGSAAILVQNSSSVAINGAIVTLNGTSVTTGSDGKAIFSNVPTGTYNYTVTKNDYSDSNTNNITITTTTTIPATPTVTLTRQTGSVTILVQNSSNVAIGGAIVTLNGISVTTGSDGKAVFSNVPTGTYNYTVTATDYNDSNTNDISITTTTTTPATPVATLIRKTGSATITVYDKSTNSPNYTGTTPFSGGNVRVTINGITHDVTTDSSGVANFNDLPVGTYTFKVTSASYSGWLDSTANITVTVTAGSTKTATISVHGKGGAEVTVSDGINPVSGATVRFVRNSDGAPQAHLTTDASGKARIANSLVTGTYYVTVTKEGYATAQSGIFTIAPGEVANVSVPL